MSYHFPQVFPLISDRSVLHNGKHPGTTLFPEIFQWNEPKYHVPLTTQPEFPEFLGKWKTSLKLFTNLIHLKTHENDGVVSSYLSTSYTTRRNIVGCNMLRAFCNMLGQPTTPNMSRDVATRWPNERNMLRPAMLRCVVLACCDHLAGA